MGPGTIYGSLQRMEDAGLVKEVSTSAGDRRRLFALQPAGRRALEAEARAPGAIGVPGAQPAAPARTRPDVSAHRWSRARIAACCARIRSSSACHFRADMEADFAEMLRTRGRVAAWRRVPGDWADSVRSTRAHARESAARARAIAYRGETRMSSLLFDFRHVLRGLVKAPVFSRW